jgi:hypothetical protein
LATADSLATVGIQNVSKPQEEVKVFPNPSDGVFNFEAPSNSPIRGDNYTIVVYSVLGQQVASSNSSKGGAINSLPSGGSGWAVDLSGHPSGIYFYRLTDKQGALIQSGKLILQ